MNASSRTVTIHRSTTPTESQIQGTCPEFCEQSEHENIDTAETPVYVHATESHVVHGVHMYVSTATDADGVEVEDDALGVFLDGRQLSVREAHDIGYAILSAASRAELSIPDVKAALDVFGASRYTYDVGQVAMAQNHEKHLRLRR